MLLGFAGRTQRAFSACNAARTTGSRNLEGVSNQNSMADNLYKHGLNSLSPACPVSHILEGSGQFKEVPLDRPSSFVRPRSLLYQQAGRERRWDVVQAHDSVAIVLYNKELHSFIIVRQFRPAVYAVKLRAAAAAGQSDPDPAVGLTYELCAGIVDKPGKTLQQVCCEEVLEEVGYQLEPEHLVSCAGSIVSSAGITGASQAMFYAEVNEGMRACPDGGTRAAKERVEALALPLDAVHAFVADDMLAKTPGLCFGLLWGRQRLLQQ
eukprot:GHRR01009016.1.p1 GENE.GHRR01009016.1~~GHRR01009016.1.p1  ORF type:complete len:266 (+),score=78.55 GHRR01009016.1:224-1021(+)